MVCARYYLDICVNDAGLPIKVLFKNRKGSVKGEVELTETSHDGDNELYAEFDGYGVFVRYKKDVEVQDFLNGSADSCWVKPKKTLKWVKL